MYTPVNPSLIKKKKKNKHFKIEVFILLFPGTLISQCLTLWAYLKEKKKKKKKKGGKKMAGKWLQNYFGKFLWEFFLSIFFFFFFCSKT